MEIKSWSRAFPCVRSRKLVLTKRAIATVLYLSSSRLRQPVLSCCSASSENREFLAPLLGELSASGRLRGRQSNGRRKV